MKRNRKKFFRDRGCMAPLGAMLLFFGIVSATGCAGRTVQYTAVDTAMGTVIRQSIYTNGGDVTEEVESLITALEQDYLSWRIADSEVARINATAGTGEQTALSDELAEDFALLLQVSEKSGGAFDCSIGSVIKLWNIDAWAAGENVDVILPEAEAVEQALQNTGYEKIQWENGHISIPEQMSLDLGAVGKGIACDRIAAYLEEEEVYGAVISVGGSILTFGKKPDGTPWQVGIVDPLHTESMIGVLSLEGEWFVSTSGDYERYVEVDAIRYHHILDPATGYPADSGVRSVTILCKSGILSDALSTACFVLGEEKGMELAESYGAEALFVDTQGNISMTDGMKDFFRKTGEK